MKLSKIKTFVISVLPGIFLMGYNVGTGSITSMSKAGANFGLDLLWAVLISCLITYYLLLCFSRYTMATQKTILEGMKEHIHPGLVIALIMVLSIIILGALVGVLGILSSVLREWFIARMQLEWHIGVYATLISVVLYLLLWIGTFQLFEKVLAFMVAVMSLAFLVTMFLNFPSLGDFVGGFIPGVPKSSVESDNTSLSIVAGMIGTTVSVFTFIIRTQSVKQAGWDMSHWKLQRRDAAVSAFLMFLISMAVMVTASTTLYQQGLTLNKVTDMIYLMEPIAGRYALTIFVLGTLAAGLSSHLPNLLVIPWLVIDYKNEPRETRTKRNRVVLLILTVSSALGVAFGIKPVFIMIFSQACIGIVLPIVIASLFYLTTQKKIMGDYRNKALDNLLLSAILLFSLLIGSLGIKGVILDLSKMFS